MVFFQSDCLPEDIAGKQSVLLKKEDLITSKELELSVLRRSWERNHISDIRHT